MGMGNSVNLWRTLRNLDRIEALESALAEQTGEASGAIEAKGLLGMELTRERDRRVSSEALAAERRTEIDRLDGEIKYLREQLNAALTDRLKSLDLVNQRLMEPRVEAPPPDLKQFSRESAEAFAGQAIRKIRDINRSVDMAVLAKMHPKFSRQAPARPMNEPAQESA